MEHPKKQTYFWLLAVNLFISSFTFGGGYVVVPMIRRYFVTQKQYFTEEDLVGMAAVAQSTPGAIAINLSALAGYRVAGTLGAAISCIAAVIPPPCYTRASIGILYSFYLKRCCCSRIKRDAGGRSRTDCRSDHRHVRFDPEGAFLVFICHDTCRFFGKLCARY